MNLKPTAPAASSAAANSTMAKADVGSSQAAPTTTPVTSSSASAAATTAAATPANPTPKLAAEEYAWNAPSRGMARFHNSHKRTFNNSYTHAEDYAEVGYTLQSFLRESYNLVIHLGNHHGIEEEYIFPMLAHKHPAFREGAEHKEDHALIHHALERYAEYLEAAMEDPDIYTPEGLRALLDSFREPLMRHLDQEIEDLKPESLRKYGFTLAEVRRLPF